MAKRVAMGLRAVVAGLGGSPFLAGVDARDREPARIAGTVLGGLGAGVLLGLVVGMAVLIAYAFAAGAGGAGVEGMLRQIVALLQADAPDLLAAVFILMVPAATNAPTALVFIAMAALLTHHRIRNYVTAAVRVRWRLLAAGLAMNVILTGALMLIDQWIAPGSKPAPILSVSAGMFGRAAYAIAAVALLIPAAAAEEIVFRGWLLRQTAAFLRNPVTLLVVNGVLFSAIHLDFAPDAFLARSVMGAGFAYMTLRLGGIEFATGAHAANNILIVLFVEPLILKPSEPTGFSAGTVLEDVLLVIGYVVITELVVRWPRLRRLTRIQDEELSVPHLD
ncbi:MAG TPA: type II CAAX endopeptidase family protein [Caulobacteraceae bacterium]|jgi:hypothetical protein|nr:type II CAAX endopeptidase family protein [Caulobacteraceae bacterium]